MESWVSKSSLMKALKAPQKQFLVFGENTAAENSWTIFQSGILISKIKPGSLYCIMLVLPPPDNLLASVQLPKSNLVKPWIKYLGAFIVHLATEARAPSLKKCNYKSLAWSASDALSGVRAFAF